MILLTGPGPLGAFKVLILGNTGAKINKQDQDPLPVDVRFEPIRGIKRRLFRRISRTTQKILL